MADAVAKLHTEKTNAGSLGIDECSANEALSTLFLAQIAAARSVEHVISEIELASSALADAIVSSNKLFYVAAGSSALMALADGLELPGTYGLSNDDIKIIMAGGAASLSEMTGGPEDDWEQGGKDIQSAGIKAGDCVICLSASGSTPYVLGTIAVARSCGAKIIGIANNADTPVLTQADISIYLCTPPEVVAGSTRMGAGTAQKIALNMMTTLMAVHLGHVHDGLMVNLKADNIKLQKRALGIICSISNCDEATAKSALKDADGNVKLAVLLASGAKDIKQGTEILERNGHKLRPALSEL